MTDLEDILNPAPEHMKTLVLKALREDEGRLEHNLQLLETWMSCQRHLPKNYEKKLLINFLRGCKHDLQCTKKKLERYLIIRTVEEAFFRNRMMTAGRDLMVTKYGFVCTLPELSPEGYRVTLREVTSIDDSTLSVLQFIRYELMICDIRIYHELMVTGDVFVYDIRNLSSSFAKNILCPDVWKVIDMVQNTLPVRPKQLHIIITHSIFAKIVQLIKQVLSDKLAKRIYVHPNMEGVFKVIPQRLFPSDYGGEKKSTREIVEQWNEKFVELEGWFQKLDEVKVSGPIPKEFDQMFSDVYGPEGSFRQINLD